METRDKEDMIEVIQAYKSLLSTLKREPLPSVIIVHGPSNGKCEDLIEKLKSELSTEK